MDHVGDVGNRAEGALTGSLVTEIQRIDSAGFRAPEPAGRRDAV